MPSGKTKETKKIKDLQDAKNAAAYDEFDRLLDLCASHKEPLLLLGESGAGKGYYAEEIHKRDQKRNQKPFIGLNCGAIPETLFETEMFGAIKGAHNVATEDKDGQFVQANEGTLFLDEISELTSENQAKLLKVLDPVEGGKYSVPPVGIRKPEDIKIVDIRLIFGTNKDLKKEVETKNFREDLYYRLNPSSIISSITIPSLRQRLDEIESHLKVACKTYEEDYPQNQKIEAIELEALAYLKELRWRGNVREFRTVIRGACIIAAFQDCAVLQKGHFPTLKKFAEVTPGDIPDTLESAEYPEYPEYPEDPEFESAFKTVQQALEQTRTRYDVRDEEKENFTIYAFYKVITKQSDLDPSLAQFNGMKQRELLGRMKVARGTYVSKQRAWDKQKEILEALKDVLKNVKVKERAGE